MPSTPPLSDDLADVDDEDEQPLEMLSSYHFADRCVSEAVQFDDYSSFMSLYDDADRTYVLTPPESMDHEDGLCRVPMLKHDDELALGFMPPAAAAMHDFPASQPNPSSFDGLAGKFNCDMENRELAKPGTAAKKP